MLAVDRTLNGVSSSVYVPILHCDSLPKQLFFSVHGATGIDSCADVCVRSRVQQNAGCMAHDWPHVLVLLVYLQPSLCEFCPAMIALWGSSGEVLVAEVWLVCCVGITPEVNAIQ